MKYCENCRMATENSICALCGNRRLRQVANDDFCLLTENSAAYCNGLADIFKENGIVCSAMPYARDIESNAALPFYNCRLFVPFRYLERAKTIIKDIENSETEKLRDYLLKNEYELNISAKTEKKISKRIKPADGEDLLDYCAEIIKSAQKITDEGVITGDLKNGHYLVCVAKDATLTLNSKTFEIISLTTR